MKERPRLCFEFTEREKLYDHISHNRFMALVMQPDVDVHEVTLSSNSFVEYLFVILSCRTDHPKTLYTFWGCGWHEYRERWIVDMWQWFESYRGAEQFPVIPKEEAYNQIKEREAFVRVQMTPMKPSHRARMYGLLADLVDEDGALAGLEDLGWIFWDDGEAEGSEQA